MAPIVGSAEIARRPEDVFAYITDPANLTEWQEDLVSARLEGDAPVAVGSKAVTTRHMGGRDRAMTMEFTKLSPPTAWALRGIDSPVRASVDGTIESLDDGARSRVTIQLDFQGHGIGMLLVPLVVRRQAKAGMPGRMQKLKEVLENTA